MTDSFGGKNKFKCQMEQRSVGIREQQEKETVGESYFDLLIIKHFPITFLKDV